MKRFLQRINIPLLAILIVAIFLRLYNTPLRYLQHLDNDQVRDAMIVYQSAKELQLPLIGAFSSVGAFTFGPWYYWQLILFQIIIPTVFSPWIYMSIMSVIFVLLMYKIGEVLWDKKLGLICSLLTAVAGVQIDAGVNISNLILVAPFAATTLFLLLKLLETQKSSWWYVLFGLFIGITVNLHYQAAGLLILPALLIFKEKKFEKTCCLILGIFFSFLPLLFFDLNNHWFNLRNILDYYLIGQYRVYYPDRWLTYVGNFWPSFLGFSLGTNSLLAVAVTLLGLGVTLKKAFSFHKNPALTFCLLTLAINFFLLRFYRGPRSFGYLFYLMPFVYLFSAIGLRFLLDKVLVWQLIAMLYLSVSVFVALKSQLPLIFSPSFSPDLTNAVNDAKMLINSFPNDKLAIYNCQTWQKIETRQVVFVLNYLQHFSENGRKIGWTSRCLYPSHTSLSKSDPEYFLRAAKFFPQINTSPYIDLSAASESAIISSGWNKVTQKAVYDEGLRWWFDEKP